MLYANTSSPAVYWRIPSADWRAYLEQCHKSPDTLKEPYAMLSQSCDLPQLQRSAQLCRLNESQNSGKLGPPREIFPSLQTNYYILLVNFDQNQGTEWIIHSDIWFQITYKKLKMTWVSNEIDLKQHLPSTYLAGSSYLNQVSEQVAGKYFVHLNAWIKNERCLYWLIKSFTKTQPGYLVVFDTSAWACCFVKFIKPGSHCWLVASDA